MDLYNKTFYLSHNINRYLEQSHTPDKLLQYSIWRLLNISAQQLL